MYLLVLLSSGWQNAHLCERHLCVFSWSLIPNQVKWRSPDLWVNLRTRRLLFLLCPCVFVSSPSHLLPSLCVSLLWNSSRTMGQIWILITAHTKRAEEDKTVCSFCMLAFSVKKIDGFIMPPHCVHVWVWTRVWFEETFLGIDSCFKKIAWTCFEWRTKLLWFGQIVRWSWCLGQIFTRVQLGLLLYSNVNGGATALG